MYLIHGQRALGLASLVEVRFDPVTDDSDSGERWTNLALIFSHGGRIDHWVEEGSLMEVRFSDWLNFLRGKWTVPNVKDRDSLTSLIVEFKGIYAGRPL